MIFCSFSPVYPSAPTILRPLVRIRIEHIIKACYLWNNFYSLIDTLFVTNDVWLERTKNTLRGPDLPILLWS